MRIVHRETRILGAALAAAFVLVGVADAAPPPPKQVADSLVAAIVTANPQAKVTYTAASVAGNDVAVTGLSITSTEITAGTVTKLTVVNPVAAPAGGFTADRIAVDGGKLTSNNTSVAWQSGTVTGIVLPATGAGAPKTGGPSPFNMLTFNGLTVTRTELAKPVTVAAMTMALGSAGGSASDVRLTLQGIKIPVAAFDNSSVVRDLVKSLGYTTDFTMNVTAISTDAAAADALSVRSLEIVTDQVGKIALTGNTTGVAAGALQQTDRVGDLIGTAKVSQVSLRFDNSGVVDRFLDSQAKATGQTRADLVGQVTAALPFMLALVGISKDDMQTKVSNAVTTFLKNPKSLTIAIKLPTPVPLFDIIGEAKKDPDGFFAKLGLDVTAN